MNVVVKGTRLLHPKKSDLHLLQSVQETEPVTKCVYRLKTQKIAP